MDKEMEILKKLIANRLDGLTKSSFKGKSKDVLNKLIKDGFAKIVKVNRGERVFISEKGEIEYINKISKDEFQDYIKKRIDEIQNGIKKLNENVENMIKIFLSRRETTTKFKESLNLFEEIRSIYKELSSKEYSYMAGLVPIPSIVSFLVQKYNLDVQEIQKAIYDLYLKGEISLEYGDKKEGNLITPDGKSYYYLKFKK